MNSKPIRAPLKKRIPYQAVIAGLEAGLAEAAGKACSGFETGTEVISPLERGETIWQACGK